MHAESAHLEHRLDRVRRQLATELDATDPERISTCFERARRELLANARITDFLPTLVEREARACIASAARA